MPTSRHSGRYRLPPRAGQRLPHSRLIAGMPPVGFLFVSLVLITSLILGGASRVHELRLAIVELIALPALAWAGRRHLTGSAGDLSRLSWVLLITLGALPLVQLIPLPPDLWQALPGRSELALALDIAGLPAQWAPLSLTPDKTWSSFLALLPPIAVFIGLAACSPRERCILIVAVLVLSACSMVLGFAQLASGGEKLYPWATTDAGSVTGFFANRNHLASLCLMTLPFAAVMAGGALRRRRHPDRRVLWTAGFYLVLVTIALGVIRSRAGVILFVPVLAGSALVAWLASGQSRPDARMLAGAGTVVAIIGAIAVLGSGPILARFDQAGAREGRFENWPVVLEAAANFQPAGSGIGSFDPVYRSVEPVERLGPRFFNQAHNEYLEIWLEAGWVGAASLLLFLVWLARRSFTVWARRPGCRGDFGRAATVGITAVMLHSFGDYPLRTVAIACFFAMMCALLELAVSEDPDATASSVSK